VEAVIREPTDYALLTYAWVGALSMFGGLSHYLFMVRDRKCHPSFVEMIGELAVSGFAGLMTFYLCEASNIEAPMSAFLVGVSGHMGSRAIFLMERKVGAWMGERQDAKTREFDNPQDEGGIED
jgi:hypothetical protein